MAKACPEPVRESLSVWIFLLSMKTYVFCYRSVIAAQGPVETFTLYAHYGNS